MANLKNKQYATFDRDTWGRKDQVMVGNNRTLSRRETESGMVVLEFRLHGSIVVEYTRYGNGSTHTLYMTSAGYPTPTTGSAIKDALALFGFAGGVSFAKGGFAPRLSVKPYSPSREGGYEWMAPNCEGCDSVVYQWEAA